MKIITQTDNHLYLTHTNIYYILLDLYSILSLSSLIFLVFFTNFNFIQIFNVLLLEFIITLLFFFKKTYISLDNNKNQLTLKSINILGKKIITIPLNKITLLRLSNRNKFLNSIPIYGYNLKLILSNNNLISIDHIKVVPLRKLFHKDYYLSILSHFLEVSVEYGRSWIHKIDERYLERQAFTTKPLDSDSESFN